MLVLPPRLLVVNTHENSLASRLFSIGFPWFRMVSPIPVEDSPTLTVPCTHQVRTPVPPFLFATSRTSRSVTCGTVADVTSEEYWHEPLWLSDMVPGSSSHIGMRTFINRLLILTWNTVGVLPEAKLQMCESIHTGWRPRERAGRRYSDGKYPCSLDMSKDCRSV